MLVLIKGAGDLATGVAVRLKRAGMDIAMTDLAKPSAIRRSVAFSEAMYRGRAEVEGIAAVFAADAVAAREAIARGDIPVLADETGRTALTLCPDAMVDAIIAKRNTGTSISDAPIVIALGPGFTVGVDCHAAVETKRGHYMGRVYYENGQSPIPNTGIPGIIAGRGAERVMHSPAGGEFCCLRAIGDRVKAQDTVAVVGGREVKAQIDGTLRGLLPDGFPAVEGMKCADVDPRCEYEHCFSCSDKSLAMGGAVLEAIMHLTRK